MQIYSINSILNCKPKSVNYNSDNRNFKGQLNDAEDIFVSAKDEKIEKRERAKFVKNLSRAVWRHDTEELEKLLSTGKVTPRNLRRLKHDYEAELRHPWRGEAPSPRIGELINIAIANTEINKINQNPNKVDQYSDIKSKIQYDSDDNRLSMEFLKQAIKRKDPVLLRVTIDTLRKNNKPYGQILFDSIDSLLQEKNNS